MLNISVKMYNDRLPYVHLVKAISLHFSAIAAAREVAIQISQVAMPYIKTI